MKYLVLALVLTGCNVGSDYRVTHVRGDVCVIFKRSSVSYTVYCKEYSKEAVTEAYAESDRLNKLKEKEND